MLDLLHEIERELGGHPEELNEAERLDALESRRNVMRMLQALTLTSLLLLVFSSERLLTWVNGFEVGPVQDAVVSASTAWHDAMSEAGLTGPARSMRGEVDEFRATDWAEIRHLIERESTRTREGVRLLRGAVSDRQG
ncbi:hypothetical protein [Parvibaculum sp.]|uniref:hypothetical protein n=1 Tax=Parvibaculum sp. TaxID=2024848 RepID=UPI000EC6A3F2|nr:hypothetical protein [Parvibaculum sp.]MBO6667979.1 hypothetical protein [Parvibaculum sp.]MBO6690592.1 hypothetical protein [Parvibaculum sp.]MBO6714785.1 hypothetical protein [Parvibaculum sp.]HAC60155.1 hypothetical protein [Rhodobiaceae bacterium]